MYIDEDSWTHITPAEVLYTLRLSEALNESWSEDTAYPNDVEKWTTNNPSIGQCAVTSLIVQDFVNGVIHSNSKFHHYWNQLPSGASVDFTHEQFGIDGPINSQGKVERKALLKRERSAQAFTKQRYKVLRKRVKDKIRNLEPTLFLLSSNAEPEYIHDIIESVAIPEGTIHHFRYMSRYVDKALRKLIPLQGEKGPVSIVGTKAIIGYLNQKISSSGAYEWNDSIPIRTAIVRECYKTGEADNSVMHFFFAVYESLLKTDTYGQDLRQIFGKSFEKAYAFLTFADTTQLVTKHCSGEVFETQCDKLRDIGFTFEKGEQKIDYEPPLLILFEGLYKNGFPKTNVAVKPSYDAFVPKSYYRLIEGIPYRYRFRTYTWKFRKPYQIKLSVPTQLFCTPDEHLLVVKSAYDSECWELTPSFTEQSTSGYMILEIKNIEMSNGTQSKSIELDWKISTMFKIKRRRSLRILDTLCDLLFALGPVYIAATKIFDNTSTKPIWIEFWPYVLAGIYFTWVLVKIVRRSIGGV